MEGTAVIPITIPTLQSFASPRNNCHSDAVLLKQLRNTSIGARVAVEKQNGRGSQGGTKEKEAKKKRERPSCW